MRILLIDDDYSIIENLTLFLEQAFYAVESRTWVGSKEDLKVFLEEFQPHGVILDFGMDPPGIEICEWVREWNQNMPIVFYTSYGQNDDYRDQMQVHVQDNQIILKREVGKDIESLLRALGF